MAHTLEMVSRARADGVDVRIDLMPSNWNHTAVAAFLPSWAFEGGISGVVELLTSAEGREKLKHDPQPIWQAVTRGEWWRIRLFVSEANARYIGMTFEEIARERGQDPHEVVFDLLLEEGPAAARMICVGDNFSEDDIRLALKDPFCSVISDTAAIAPDGPYGDTKISPLSYNWAPRFFQKYIREEKILSLEEGVRRVTRLPASAIGLLDRGTLRKGAMADITVFDRHKIADRATIEEPNVYPAGIEYVIVNGKVTIHSGDRRPIRSGMVLRRS
jgi:N-acyl-D-aspartate/D-glutamate deacylase